MLNNPQTDKTKGGAFSGAAERGFDADSSSALARDFLRKTAFHNPAHLKVVARLEKVTNRNWTIADVLRVKPEEISGHKGIGSTYVRYYAELQELLKAYVRGESGTICSLYNAPQILKWLQSGGYELNWACLSLSERRALRKLESDRGQEAGAADVVHVSISAPIQKTNGLIDQIGERILQEAAPFSEQPPSEYEPAVGSLLVRADIPDLTLAQFCAMVIEDIHRFIDALEGLQRDIFATRFGIGCPADSLTSLGKKHGRTRERIRQIEAETISFLRRSFSLSRQTRERIGRENECGDPAVAYAPLMKRFSSPRQFYRFLEICVGIDASAYSYESLAKMARESRKLLRPILCENPAPLSREMLTEELIRRHKLSGDRAKALVLAGERSDQLIKGEGGLYPRGMTKRDAVAHLLAGYPEGLAWRRAGDLLKRSGACKTPVLSSQPTQEFSHNSYLYLMGPGRYRHRRFLDASNIDVPEMLRAVRAFIAENGMLSANLQTIHRNVPACAALDYFILRHLVSVHGEAENLYFDGRSRSDSVSIEIGADRASQKRHVYDMLRLAGKPAPFKRISESVLAQNESSARQLLDRLRREGLVARTQVSTYATIEVARRIHDFEALGEYIDEELARVGKPIDLRAVRERYMGPAKLSLDSQRRLFTSAAPLCFLYDYVHVERERRGWHASRDLIGREPLPYSSVKRAYEALRKPHDTVEDAVASLSEAVELSLNAQRVLIPRWVAADLKKEREAENEQGG